MLHFMRLITIAAACSCWIPAAQAGEVCDVGQQPPCCKTNFVIKDKRLSFSVNSRCPLGNKAIIDGIKNACPDCTAPTIKKAPDGSKTIRIQGINRDQTKAITKGLSR